jgi:hypothetical protein
VSAYNTVSAKLRCPACGSEVTVPVQFKFGNTWQFHYDVGEVLRWGGNDIGERGKRHVVVDGVVAGKCPRCRYDGEWNVYIHIEDDRIARVENATGKFDFAKYGSNYIVIE